MAKQGRPVQQILEHAPGTAERAVKTSDCGLQHIANLLEPCLAPDDLIDQGFGHPDLLWGLQAAFGGAQPLLIANILRQDTMKDRLPQVDSDTEAQLDRLIAAAGNSTRRAILLALLADRRAYTIDQVAEIAGVHRTVAFGHLERLADLGLLMRTRRHGRRGKPASLYSAVEGGLVASVPQRQSERLATLLAASLSGFGRPGRTAARLAGRRYGESFTADRAASAASALGPLQKLGGAYEVEGKRIVARNCIFRETCSTDPALVCGLHAGIIEGVLHSAGIAAHVEPTGPVQPGGCGYLMKAA